MRAARGGQAKKRKQLQRALNFVLGVLSWLALGKPEWRRSPPVLVTQLRRADERLLGFAASLRRVEAYAAALHLVIDPYARGQDRLRGGHRGLDPEPVTIGKTADVDAATAKPVVALSLIHIPEPTRPS